MASSIGPSVSLNILFNYLFLLYIFIFYLSYYSLSSDFSERTNYCPFIVRAIHYQRSFCVLMDFGASHDTPTSSSLLFIMHAPPHACSSSCVLLIIHVPHHDTLHHARTSSCLPLILSSFYAHLSSCDSSACMLLIYIGIYSINNTSKPIHQK